VYVISRDNAKFFVQFKVNIANKFFSGFFILNFYIGLAQLVTFYSEHVRGTGRKNGKKGNFTLAILRFGDFAFLQFCIFAILRFGDFAFWRFCDVAFLRFCDFLIVFAFGLAIWQFVLRFCNFAFGYRDFKNCDSWSLFLSH
jgi:hypothetical protein